MLTQRAQITLGVGKGRLLDSSGVVLDGCSEITNSRIHKGDWLALHVSRVQIQCTDYPCAAILGDGSVATWGHGFFGGDRSSGLGLGGDSRAVQDQLKKVQRIQSSPGVVLVSSMLTAALCRIS